MKRALLSLVVVAAIGGSVYAYFHYKDNGPKFTVSTTPITRGDVVETVGATGTLQAVTTVQVGTQVSGTIQSLYADFNSLVKKGQVLARLDPSLFQTQIEQASANLIRAQADLERLRVALDDARTKLARARELSGRQLIPKSELETAEVNVRAAEAQIRSSEAQVTQAQASVNQNQVNLQHTVIEAPIDGLVISRSVDVGQTVAASMQAPTLFLLAADLTKMQVVANLDESDVGRIRPGQQVTFRVDAYPADNFIGIVSQVRLEPKVQQNVVTYATVIDVPNNELKLKPGMTANVNIEIARSSNVLRVPNSALRFRPTNEIFAALGQTPPEPGGRGDFAGRGGGGAGEGDVPSPQGRAAGSSSTAPSSPTIAAPAPGGARQGAAPSGGPAANVNAPTARAQGGAGRGAGPGTDRDGVTADPTERRGRGGLAARMQNLSPEEREQMLQRMRARGIDPTTRGVGSGAERGGAAAAGAGRGRKPADVPATAPAAGSTGGATTIDALFGPLARVETVGRVWLYVQNQLRPVRLRLGVSDGQMTELVEGDLQPGTEVVTNVATTAEARPAANNAFPFMGQPQRGGFPGGQGGNRNNGRGGR